MQLKFIGVKIRPHSRVCSDLFHFILLSLFPPTALNGKYTVDIVQLGLGDIIGYGIKTGSVSCAKSGYTPIGIVGYATIGTSGESVKVNIGNLFIDNGKVECAVFNISSTTVTGYYINVRVLYSKNL